MVDLFRGYNSLIQPVTNLSETPTMVSLALQLILLINVYNSKELQLKFEDKAKEAVDLSEYGASSIWDVIEAPGKIVNDRSRIEYSIKIRRKTLFYTVVLIIPTVLMAFLSMAVFFLPADSGEKITLTISVLLSIVVFLLLVSKILPPTSKTIPLMAKYLLLTFVLNVITILVTVIIINIYYRGPTTHKMPEWVHMIFLDFLPKLLCMKRPKPATNRNLKMGDCNGTLGSDFMQMQNNYLHDPELLQIATEQHHPKCHRNPPPAIDISHADDMDFDRRSAETRGDSSPALSGDYYPLTPDAYRAIEAIEYITDHLKQDEEYKIIRDDWKYVAMIIDRLLLYVFFGVTLGGTLGILLSAPSVFEFVDQQAILARLKNTET